MAGHPSDRLESLTQRLKIKLCIRIVLSYAQQHADASHPLGLLRTRRERPRSHAAEQRDELAPSQWIELHSVPAAKPDRRIIERAGISQEVTERFYNLWAADAGGDR
jgi:hypothetical protein